MTFTTALSSDFGCDYILVVEQVSMAAAIIECVLVTTVSGTM